MMGIRATKLRGHVAVVAVFASCFAGCGKSTTAVVGTPPPPQHIAKILGVWVEYERANKKPAASANDLKSFVETQMKADQEKWGGRAWALFATSLVGAGGWVWAVVQALAHSRP